MTANEFDRVIADKLDREPFQPFTIELLDGRKLDIVRPFSIAIRNGDATCFAGGTIHLHILSEEVSRIVDKPSTLSMTA